MEETGKHIVSKMEIFNNGRINVDRQTVYLDVDDVVLNSRATVVHMLQNWKRENNIPDFGKTEHAWNFGSTLRGMTGDDINKIFSSEEFWGKVGYIEGFVEPYIERFVKTELYNTVFVTKGDEANVRKKFAKLSERFDMKQCGYIALKYEEPKSIVHMFDGIHIDDNYDFLKDTDARLKILFREVDDSDCNGFWKLKDNLPRLYVCQMPDEIIDILEFNLEVKL